MTDADAQTPAADARTPLRNRIVGHGDVAPGALLANPKNWRTHPAEQRDALEGVLDEVGWVAEVIVNQRTNFIVDGHGRVEIAIARGEATVPVKYVDLSDAEEALILATFDPISALAGRDDAKVRELLASVQTDDGAVRELLASVQTDDGAVRELLASIAGAAAPLPVVAGETAAPAYSLDDILEAGLAYFRATGFPYRKLAVHECMQEINTLRTSDGTTLERTLTAYQVADTYHPHRFHAHAAQMRSPVQSFEKDRLLLRAMRLHVESGGTLAREYFGTLNIVSGTQACANFRPGYAALMYRRYCPPGGTVLDTSTGYGGRLVGAFASGVVGHYIGIDPNTITHAANHRMCADLHFDRTMGVLLINEPAEDVSIIGVPHLANACDFAFTSPPYFAKEEYSAEDTQSWKRYPTGELWRDGFLKPMLALQFAALKPGARNVINIADVTIRNVIYPLTQWVQEDALAAGFVVESAPEAFTMARRVGTSDPEHATEPVFLFRKPA